MLTPVDIQNKVFKGGIGFDKRDVETFMTIISSDYEKLYRLNVELKDKISSLNDSLQHYRTIEDSIQKALTISEKTAEETINAANNKSRELIRAAEKQAESIVDEANQELLDTKNEIFRLQQQHSIYKDQFKKMLDAQLKIMDGEMIDIDLGADFEGMSDSFSGGLGGLGGGYVGSMPDGFERTNQTSAFNQTSLNTDPFSNAMNGGGRFSKHTSNVTNGKKKKEEKGSGSTFKNVDTPVDDNAVYGEVEDKKKESTMLDSEDNHTQGFDFVEEGHTASVKDDVVFGEVEDKLNESTMLDSEDNHTEGFDFVNDESSVSGNEDDVFSGEVESRVQESTMLDSEDNHMEGFNFVSDDEAEKNLTDTFSTVSSAKRDSAKADKRSFRSEREEVFEGDVEDVKRGNLIGNEDDEEEGFKFF